MTARFCHLTLLETASPSNLKNPLIFRRSFLRPFFYQIRSISDFMIWGQFWTQQFRANSLCPEVSWRQFWAKISVAASPPGLKVHLTPSKGPKKCPFFIAKTILLNFVIKSWKSQEKLFLYLNFEILRSVLAFKTVLSNRRFLGVVKSPRLL